MQPEVFYIARRVMPCLPVQAAHSSNVSASVCLAQVDDARGDTRSALKYWAKAAKLGHPEAQFRLGRVRLNTVITSCWCKRMPTKGFLHMYAESVKPISISIQPLHSQISTPTRRLRQRHISVSTIAVQIIASLMYC